MKVRTAWIVCLGSLFASLCLFYPQVFWLTGGLLTGDHKEQHYPWACFLSESLSRGTLPWWTWKIHCGFPLLAEGQIAALYPPNLLLHALLPAHTAYSLNFLLHVFLSGAFFAAYCRGLKLSWPSVALATLVYLYGNAFGGAYYNITSLKTLCWFPLSLLFIDKLCDTGRLRYGVFLGITFALALLAGYLQIAVYAIAMALVYFVLKLVFRDKGPGNAAGRFSESAKALMGFAAALFVMGFLFLPQFLATYPLSQMSARTGLQESFSTIGSFPPWGMVTLMIPKLEGLLGTLGLYAGVLPLFLLLLSVGNWQEASVRRWWLMLGLSLLLAMGGYSPLYVGLVKLTHFYGFRIPSKLLFFSNTALAVLAGWGIEGWLRQGVSPKAWQATKVVFFAACAGTLCLGLSGGWFLDIGRDSFLQWAYAWAKKNVYGKPYHPYGLDHYYRIVDAHYQNARELFRITNPKLWISLVWIIVTCGVLSFVTAKSKKNAIVLCCLSLAFGDLYSYHFINKLVGDFSTYAQEIRPGPTTHFLQKDKSLYRIFGYRSRSDTLSLIPSYNLLCGIEDIGAYSPFVVKRYKELLEGLGAVDDSTGRIVSAPGDAMRLLPLLSMMNVKYILATQATVLPGLKEVFATGTERVFQNTDVQDRFFLAQRAEVEKDPKTLLEKVRGMEIASVKTVWLEQSADLPASLGGGTVRVVRYDDRKIVLDLEASDGTLLFGSILYYPGVTAELDGRPAHLLRANYCFCAVVVPQGRHRLVFRFDWKKSLGFP